MFVGLILFRTYYKRGNTTFARVTHTHISKSLQGRVANSIKHPLSARARKINMPGVSASCWAVAIASANGRVDTPLY